MNTSIAASAKLTKRHKIAYSSVLYAVLMMVVLLANLGWWGAFLMACAGYVLVVHCLDFDLHLEEWIVFPLYGVLASISYYTWMSQYGFEDVTRTVGICAAFGLGMYSLMLTLNILNISTVRVLPLARTAKTVLSFMGVILSFSLFQLTAIGQPPLINWAIGVGGISFLIAWPLVWTSINKKQKLLSSMGWALLIGLTQTQLAAIAGWWPVSYMTSLFLSIMLYIFLGVLHFQEQKQVSGAEKRQYVFLAVIMTLGYYFVSRW